MLEMLLILKFKVKLSGLKQTVAHTCKVHIERNQYKVTSMGILQIAIQGIGVLD